MINRMATVCASIFIAMALIIAWLNPATGYELDIYASTPLAIWLLIGASMIIGAGIILHQLFTQGYKHNRAWMLGFAVLVVARLALLWIPYVRGYVTWGGDNITHWGMIIDVLDTGHLYSENSYPVTHSMLAQVIQLTGLPIRTVTNLSTGLFSAFYIVLIYLLSTRVIPKPKYRLATVLLAGFILVLGEYSVFLMPNGWSILFMPLLFFLYFSKAEKFSFTFPFILMLVLYPFFHPLSSLMLGLSFLVLLISSALFWYYIRQNAALNAVSAQAGQPLTPAILQFVMLIPWVLSFNQFIPNIRNMWAQITSGAPSQFGDISDILSKINMTGWDTVILFFKLYGVTTFMILLSITGIIIALAKSKNSKAPVSYTPLIVISSLIVFFGFLYLLYLVGFPGMSSIGGQRLLSYVAIFTPLVGGYALVQLLKNARCKPLVAGVTIMVIAISAFMGVRSLYFSPYQLQPNGQITTHSIAGSEWYIEYKNLTHKAATIMSPINRYADGILGRSAAASRTDLRSSRIIQVEDHFGYQEYDTLGEQYSEDLLLNITKKDRVIYDTVWEEVDRFDEDDFIKLHFDYTANKVYGNNEFASCYIKSQTSIKA
ncbi:MAG: hypothetical protein PHS35_00170 [Dehalococcoidales bacterium]|nr:hypothetical protein [Dehalococcoidales bacterium]